jgi:hypothetical protein
MEAAMKTLLLLILMTSPCALAQNAVNVTHYQTSGPEGVTAWAGMAFASGPPVEGAPYAATVTSKFAQTLSDGTLLVQTSASSTARDSAGRTRQDAPAPMVDDPSVHPPQLVFLQDPVAHASYVLNLTDKTAQKTAMPTTTRGTDSPVMESRMLSTNVAGAVPIDDDSLGPMLVTSAAGMSRNEKVHSENLGSQTMEGLLVNGTRTTCTIPAGEIGNIKPIEVISEVWTSPDLKTVIYSKLSDPRTGEHIFQLTDIVRAEPDPSLFVVPGDFRIVDGPESISFGANP